MTFVNPLMQREWEGLVAEMIYQESLWIIMARYGFVRVIL